MMRMVVEGRSVLKEVSDGMKDVAKCLAGLLGFRV